MITAESKLEVINTAVRHLESKIKSGHIVLTKELLEFTFGIRCLIATDDEESLRKNKQTLEKYLGISIEIE